MVAEKKQKRSRARTFSVVAILACTATAFVAWRVSSSRARRQEFDGLLRDDTPAAVLDEAVESRIRAFCSDCHAMPRADSFPRYAWHDKVRRGYEFYAQSGRNDLEPPPIHQTITYYRARAPEQLVFPSPKEANTELRAKFIVERPSSDDQVDIPPAVSHLRWTRLVRDQNHVLLSCDMIRGSVEAFDFSDGKIRSRILARLNNPCHVEPCDLDGNDTIDLLVADLGTHLAIDHDRGRVVWLRPQSPEGPYEAEVLSSGLGRVADARPIDIGADGDTDVIVADFGMNRTGKILLLRNVAGPNKPPRFEEEILDGRPGTIHVPVLDLNGDSRPDFLALVSQQYEQVEAFINQGSLQFDVHTLWAAPDLAFGSSGIEVVDLDADGDQDILYTNGDAFDDSFVNPSHGVGWLENVGDMQFTYHRLTDLIGAYRALAADIDLDGDLDIMATAWIPAKVEPVNATARPLASLVCLEQTSQGVFVRHTLEEGDLFHAALEVADFDADGDPDLAVGSHSISVTKQLPYQLAIWWNQTIPSDE